MVYGLATCKMQVTKRKEERDMREGMNHKAFDVGSLGKGTRVMLKDEMMLTGAEISVNRLGAGKSIPFVHSHKRNEEIYLFTGGKGKFWLDGAVLEVQEGTAVRVSPAGQRCLKADDARDLQYYCIQVEANSLVQSTRQDGVLVDVKPDWGD